MANIGKVVTQIKFEGDDFDSPASVTHRPADGSCGDHCGDELALVHRGRILAGEELESRKRLTPQRRTRAQGSAQKDRGSTTSLTGNGQQVANAPASKQRVKNGG
jgi:hypothetical protein